jgi:hypothetical protein
MTKIIHCQPRERGYLLNRTLMSALPELATDAVDIDHGGVVLRFVYLIYIFKLLI